MVPKRGSSWPIGCGKEFKGVYDRNTKDVSLFKAAMNGQKEVETKEIAVDDEALLGKSDRAILTNSQKILNC